MAKKSSNSSQHSIHGSLTSGAASQHDSSRVISSKRSVSEGATRDSVAVGTGTGKDGGKLK